MCCNPRDSIETLFQLNFHQLTFSPFYPECSVIVLYLCVCKCLQAQRAPLFFCASSTFLFLTQPVFAVDTEIEENFFGQLNNLHGKVDALCVSYLCVINFKFAWFSIQFSHSPSSPRVFFSLPNFTRNKAMRLFEEVISKLCAVFRSFFSPETNALKQLSVGVFFFSTSKNKNFTQSFHSIWKNALNKYELLIFELESNRN